jgi:Trypsin-like peptidase domain
MPGRSVCVLAPSARAIGPVMARPGWPRSVRCRVPRCVRAQDRLRCALWLLVLVLGSARAAAGCVDPATLTHSTVSITRTFGEEERKADAELLGIRGTGWFLSQSSMVTAGHVAEAMRLSSQDWKQIDILAGDNTHSIAVRVEQLAGSHAEKIAVLELQRPFAPGRSLNIRTEPLVPEEPLVSLGYPKNRLRFAGGRFVEYGGEKFAGTALLELYDGEDRLVLDHGASGAPVLDCEGRVVALVSNLFTQTMRFFSKAVRISTAWGSPNVVSVPIQALSDARRD